MRDVDWGGGGECEWVAPHGKRYVCIESSRSVGDADSERLRRYENVEVREGDMHALPFKGASFDLVVLMHALTYAAKPAQAVAEAARVLRPGGRLLLSSLGKHEHRAVVAAYSHVNLGFTEKELHRFPRKPGLNAPSSATVPRHRARALLDAAEATGDAPYVDRAIELANLLVTRFHDDANGGFCDVWD